MKTELENLPTLITMPLAFAWSELEFPDRGSGEFAKKPGEPGTYYVNVVLDPNETESTFKVDGEKRTGGQAALIAFFEEMDEQSYNLLSEDAREDGASKGKTVKKSKNETRRADGLMEVRFNMAERTAKGKESRPKLYSSSGANMPTPGGSVTKGKCEVLLLPKRVSGGSIVVRYLKSVMILEVGASREGCNFDVEDDYKDLAPEGSHMVGEEDDTGL